MPNTTTTAQSLFLCMDGVLRRVGVGGGDYYSCYDEKNAMVSLVMEKDEDYHVLLLYCGWFPSETERERGGGESGFHGSCFVVYWYTGYHVIISIHNYIQCRSLPPRD